MKILKACFLSLAWFLLITVAPLTHANNLSISNVSLGARDAKTDTLVVAFNVNWENSWRTKINHDAVWMTVRLYNPSQTPISKNLCQITNSGLNPEGSSIGSSSELELYVPSDKLGAFIRRSTNSKISSVSSEGVQLTIDYSTCSFDDDDDVAAAIFGLEMVYIPEGSFYAGDFDTSTAALHQGSSDSDPWQIASEDAINVTDAGADGYRYVSAGNAGEDASGSTFVLDASFPKGYQSFYVMKYELNESQWAEFVNSLPSAGARSNRDITNASHKNSDSVIKRNTVMCSGGVVSCTTDNESRPVSFLTWMDLASFLDWAALRPMTELEFEKTARGPFQPLPGEYVWGSTNITAASTISGSSEDGSETITDSGANANYNSTIFSGGDSSQGSEYTQGPLRNGIFAVSNATRETAGGSAYGVMELAGNLKEFVVTIGNANGRSFTGLHGDGYLTTLSSYEGNANVANWPGFDAQASRGVTDGSGLGFRGGSWQDSSSALRTSDRQQAALGSSSAVSTAGGRGVRTAE